MDFFKKLGRGIASSFLKLSLYGFAVAFAFISVLGRSDNLKQSLHQNNLYEVAVDEILDAAAQAQQNEKSSQAELLPLDSPEVRQAAKGAFPPDTLEVWTGQFIDGLYGWLDGRTEKPEFEIDITNQRHALAQSIAETAVKRVEGLRPCSRQESLQLTRQNVDLSKLECRPPVDLSAEKQRMSAEIENNQDFLGDNTISAADLGSDTGQQDPFQNNPLPSIFQWANRLPLITIIVSLSSIIGLLWLNDDKRQGFKKIGLIFLGSGLFLLISTLLFNYLFNRANRIDGPVSKIPGMEAGSVQMSLVEALKSLFGAFNSKIIFVAAIYLIVGAGILLTLHLRRQRPTA